MAAVVLRWVVLVGATLPSIYYLLAIFSAWRFFRLRGAQTSPAPTGDFTPPISILKPVRGLDPGAYENFSSFCRQDYPQYEILFGVNEPDDPAIPVIQKLIRDFPGIAIRLLIGSEELGPNRKANKLCRLAREARYDLLVINDSDIRVGPDYLRAIAGPFRDTQVGVVTCMYRGLVEPQLGSELEAIGAASDFAAGVLVARQLEGVKFALGATMATTRARLAEIGGFEALVDCHSEDFQLGNRIAARGYEVVLSQYVVWTNYPAQTLRSFFQHQLRWAVTTRYSRPWGYVGLLLTYGLPWSLAAAAVAGPRHPALAFAYPGVYLTLRLAMAFTVGVWGLKDPLLRRKWWLVPLRDALAFPVWLASFFRRRIHWRGTEFYIRKDSLVPVTARSGRS